MQVNFYLTFKSVETVKATSETAMREVIAKNEIQTILTEGRSNIEVEVKNYTKDTRRI